MDFSNGFEVFDAHVHPVSNIPKTDYSLFGFGMSVDEFREELLAAGITKCCGSVLRRLGPDDLQDFSNLHALNMAAVELGEKWPDFYIPGIHVHPKFVQESCREIETLHKQYGVNLVGELVAYSMSYNDYAVPEMDAVWELIRDYGMALNLHINRIEEPTAILAKFPTLKLIIAHPTSSIEEYDARLDLIAKYPNAAIDISGSGPNSWRMVEHGIKRAGLDKILFGTDFPIRNPSMYVAGVQAEKLTDAQKRAVFSENFKRIFL